MVEDLDNMRPAASMRGAYSFFDCMIVPHSSQNDCEVHSIKSPVTHTINGRPRNK